MNFKSSMLIIALFCFTNLRPTGEFVVVCPIDKPFLTKAVFGSVARIGGPPASHSPGNFKGRETESRTTRPC